jgi:hypothetical protein
MFRMIKRAPWIALGAGMVWFLEPEQGPARRYRLRAKLDEMMAGRSTGGPMEADGLVSWDSPDGRMSQPRDAAFLGGS